MSFREDVDATPHLAGALRKGLGALSEPDRGRMTVPVGRSLLGSVNLDAALESALPHAARWDYLVGQRSGDEDRAYWIEVHPASSTGDICAVKTKLTWLVTWMRTTPLIAYPRQFVWIASGKSAFNSRHPRVRALASRGLRFVGSHLTL